MADLATACLFVTADEWLKTVRTDIERMYHCFFLVPTMAAQWMQEKLST